jgi:molecular chaperone IbpA
MRTYDFTPLWRSSIGFDRVFDLLSNPRILEGQTDGPPYDIARTGEDTYRITLALAGFSQDEISIMAQQNLLTVAAQKAEAPRQEFLHQGIAARPFEHRFSLEDHVEVEGASFDNGLLQIDLVRRIPEAMKPRRIAIGSNGRGSDRHARTKTVAHVRAA